MRLAASLVALAASLPLHHADACGRMEAPHMFAVSQHYNHHTFVVLDEAAPADAKWRQLWPDSYDYTRIADAPALDAPMELTLLGPSGTRVVTTTKRVYLEDSFGDRTPHVALEVDVDDEEQFDVAIAGRARRASWRAIEQAPDAQNDGAAWLATHGRQDVRLAYLATIAGTTTQIVTWFDNGAHFAVRNGDADLGDHDGVVIGELDMYGQRLLVRRDLSTVAI
jgi:hypothetical protein